MAQSAVSRGSGSNGTAGQTTLVITPTSNIPVGSRAVLIIGYDNSGTSGADPQTGQPVDTKGNVWGGDANGLNDPGAANAGGCARIFSAPITVAGGLTTSDTITITFSATTVARVWALYEMVPGIDGLMPAPFNASAGNNIATTATPTITTTVLDNNTVVVACMIRQANGTRTADGDTTNGTWTNVQQAGVGVGAAGMEIICETKLVTLSATQTYNPTFGGATALPIPIWAYYEDFTREGFAPLAITTKREPIQPLLAQ